MRCTRARMKLLANILLETWYTECSYYLCMSKECVLDSEEDEQIQLIILEVSEMRWNTFGSLRTASGNLTKDDQLVMGVGLILSRESLNEL